MNSVQKKRLAVVLVFLLIAIWWTGQRVRGHLTYVEELEKFRTLQLQEWITTQRGMAYSLDRAIAEALVASEVHLLREAMAQASQEAYRGREAIWGNPPHQGIGRVFGRWDLHRPYEQIGSYLYFLAREEREGLLTPVEVENIEIIREFTAVMLSGFNELLGRVRYTEKDRDGYSTIRYPRWQQIEQDHHIPRIVDELAMKVSMLETVGTHDQSYQAFLALTRTVHEEERAGLAFSGEEELDDEDRLRRAKEFLSTFFQGEVTDEFTARQQRTSVPTSSERSATSPIVSSGYGSDRDVGEYTFFTLMDSETQWKYSIAVTEVGGHIMHLELQERAEDVGSQDELKQWATKIRETWAADEGIHLTLQEEHDEEDSHFLQSWVMKKDGITYLNHRVDLTLRWVGRPALELKASRYFHAYGSPIEDLRPHITATEAINTLSPHLQATGDPLLQAAGNRLLYAIPVTGVEGVDKIYVDAISGQFERMLYRFPQR